jgi:YVTN family beta-propeller protein
LFEIFLSQFEDTFASEEIGFIRIFIYLIDKTAGIESKDKETYPKDLSGTSLYRSDIQINQKYEQMKKNALFIILLLSAVLVYSRQAPDGGYKIANKIHLEGDEKWDYLCSDDLNSRLYVSHGSMVQVIDESTGTLAGTITGLNGVHGIAIAPDLNKGFISCGKDSSVTIFSTHSLQVQAKITVTGKGPDAIMFDAFSNRVFVFNGKSDNATVIDAITNKILATIPLDGKPEFSVSDGKGKVYVNLEDRSSIAAINPMTCKVEQIWSLSPGEEPTGLALDKENNRLFSVCKNKLMVVVDARTGKIVTSLPIGEKCDGVAFDPTVKCAYSANGDATMTIIKEDSDGKFIVVENFPTHEGARTITVNNMTHHIYQPAASFGLAAEGKKPKIIPGTFVILDIVAQ